MNRVSARFGIDVRTSGSSHRSDAAISFSAEFLAPETGIRPSSGPFPRIESLSMTDVYGAESGRHKARNRLFVCGFGLSRAIRRIRRRNGFPALQVRAQRFGQPSGPDIGRRGRFLCLFRAFPRHDGLSNTSPSQWEVFPLCGRSLSGMLP